MTSQGEQFAESLVSNVAIVNVNFCYTRPLFRLRNAHISSLEPCLNVGLLLDAVIREVISTDGFRVASATKRSSKASEGLRAQFRQVFARNTVET